MNYVALDELILTRLLGKLCQNQQTALELCPCLSLHV